MPSKPLRIIIDTNLWISFLIKKDYSKLDSILFSGQATLIFSDELLSEFITVTQRPKFERYFSRFDTLIVMTTIDKYAEFIKVSTVTTICRDEKDNFLLSLAIDGKADYLLTGDADLLVLKTIEQASIITISEFFQIISD